MGRRKFAFSIFLSMLSGTAFAGAGLTSAGVDPNPQNNGQTQEPTIAQVAPVTPTTPTTPTSVNGTTVATQAAQGAAAAAAASNAAGVASAGNAANAQASADAARDAAAKAAPPVPVDPASLPVSVIKPLNKAGADTSTAAAPPANVSVQNAIDRMATPPRREPAIIRPGVVAAQPPANAPSTPARNNPIRNAAQPAPVPPTDTSATVESGSSSTSSVFYGGLGIAGLILAASFVMFRRAEKDDVGVQPGK